MRRPPAAAPTPMPAFAPVLSPAVLLLGPWDADCVAADVDVATVPGGRDVDVGLKPLVHVMEPPALVGTICGALG